MSRSGFFLITLFHALAPTPAHADPAPALAIDYLRGLAARYRESHGLGYPEETLLTAIDDGTARALRTAFSLPPRRKSNAAQEDETARAVNRALETAFRSGASPTALRALLAHFGLPELARRLQGKIAPYEVQYLFVKERNAQREREAVEALGAPIGSLYSPVTRFFPDRIFCHGAGTEEDLATIRNHGVFPTAFGGAGLGLYGAPRAASGFAVRWGGSADRVIALRLAEHAKLVDVTTGEGLRAFEAFIERHPQADYDAFADAVGADVLRYPHRVLAFVVKNAAVLSLTPPGADSRPRKATRSTIFSFFAGIVGR